MDALSLPVLAAMSYTEWFLRTFETRALYLFDAGAVTPAEAGEPRLGERIETMEDGTALVLWEAEATDGQPTLFYLPGNAGNLSHRAERFEAFLDRGYGIVALSYRGAGGSGGKPDEASLSADALDIYDRIAATLDEPPVLYGESLGTAMAAKIAAQRETGGLVLESPFLSIVEIARLQYPQVPAIETIMTERWETVRHIVAVDEPLLVLHGTEDRLVPFDHGETLFELAPSRAKTFFAIDGAGHSETWTEAAQIALYGFLDRQ